MSERRKFLRGVGLFGALAAGAATVRANSVPVVINNNYTTVVKDEIPTEELMRQMEKNPMLTLTTTYGEEIPPPTGTVTMNGQQYTILGVQTPTYKPGTEKKVTAKLTVGPDGKLYVYENDNWRRV